MHKRVKSVAALIAATTIIPSAAFAELSSTNFRLDPNVANNFGGPGTSTSYRLVGSGGEAAVGTGSSGSYRLASGYAGQLDQSIQLNLLPTGVNAYYPLNTNTGTRAYDDTANLNDGQVTGATWTTGKIGSGLNFVAANTQRVDVPNSATLNPTSGITVEAWVKPASVPGASTNYNVVSKELYASFLGYRMYLGGYGNAGSLAFSVSNGTSRTVSTSGAVKVDNPANWYHVVGTYNGTQVKTYVNGVLTSTTATTITSISHTTDIMSIGRQAASTEYFDGAIDEVKIYNRALSDTEVGDNYSAQNAGIVSAQTIPQVTPGVSQTTSADAIVRTDAGGFDLAINQNNNLTHTDASTTIPAIGGSIASPAAWTEGTTKGLGFSVTSGTNVAAKWGTNPNYNFAAIPNSSTTFHSRTGLNGGAPQTTTLRFRLDTLTSQKSGAYRNTATVTATLKP